MGHIGPVGLIGHMNATSMPIKVFKQRACGIHGNQRRLDRRDVLHPVHGEHRRIFEAAADRSFKGNEHLHRKRDAEAAKKNIRSEYPHSNYN